MSLPLIAQLFEAADLYRRKGATVHPDLAPRKRAVARQHREQAELLETAAKALLQARGVIWEMREYLAGDTDLTDEMKAFWWVKNTGPEEDL